MERGGRGERPSRAAPAARRRPSPPARLCTPIPRATHPWLASLARGLCSRRRRPAAEGRTRARACLFFSFSSPLSLMRARLTALLPPNTKTPQQSNAAGLVVISEEDTRTLLIHRLSADAIYARQGGALVFCFSFFCAGRWRDTAKKERQRRRGRITRLPPAAAPRRPRREQVGRRAAWYRVGGTLIAGRARLVAAPPRGLEKRPAR
jgi:hypothetical protein